MPYSALTDDGDSSVEYDNNSIVSATGPCCEDPEGGTEVVVPHPWRSARLKVPTPPPPPRRSRRLRGEEAPSVNLSAHPDYARCNTRLVNNRILDKGFIQANKSQFICTLGTKQPLRSARLSRNKK